MHICFLHVNRSILNVVVDSVKNCALLNDKDAEVFEKNGEWVNRVCELANFFATVLSCHIVQIFLIKYLRVINTCVIVLCRLISTV